MSKEPKPTEPTEKTVTLTLSMPLADHLASLINAAQFSGNAGELRQLLAAHEELVTRFNEAVKQ